MKQHRILFAWLVPLALFAPVHARAEGPLTEGPDAQAHQAAGHDPATLTLERIMAHPDWIGTPPESPYWSDDGNAVLFTRKRQGEIHRDLWRLPVHLDRAHLDRAEPFSINGAPIPDAEIGAIAVDRGHWSRDRSRKVYARAGDLFVFDRATAAPRQLTRTTSREQAPRFMADEQKITFTRESHVLIRDLVTGLESEAADLRTTDDPGSEPPADDYLSRQQERLFEILRQDRNHEDARRERDRARQAADPTRPPLPWYLGKETEILQRSLSPAGGWMLLVVTDAKRDEGQQDTMPNYISDDGFVHTEEVRVKVGDGAPTDHRLLLLDLDTHERYEVDLSALPGISDDPLAAIKAATEKRQAAEKEREPSASSPAASSADEQTSPDRKGKGRRKDKGKGKNPGKKNQDEVATADQSPSPRTVEITTISWTRDGNRAAIQVHSADNKDRWIGLLTRDDRALVGVHHLSDPAGWINWSFHQQRWLAEGARLLFQSEESGWSQLYLYDVDTATTRRLTTGDQVVDDLEISPDQRYVYYTANPDHPGQYNTYRVKIEDGAREQLTTLDGITRSRLSPDGQQLLITHSTTTRPPELYLQDARPGAVPEPLTHTVSAEFEAIEWTAPAIVEIPSSHQSRPLYTRVYAPASADPGPRPAVVFVHGAGYLQNAHAGWSGYFREFMFHTLLNRAGYVVIDMDYRASRGYGRDWRTAIYRQMGTPEVEDLADGVDWLVANRHVDRRRIGVYGGSYGGFLTFMAMFKRPELFACGAALRPVTDWAHYNHSYTSNILNTPEVDPEAYERSSPIELAAGLDRPLLICTGMQDDNVFFQDSVRLVQRLIELEKTDFELAVYPIEPHGFREPFSWLDEYRRVFALFERHLKPQSPSPDDLK